MPMQRPQVLYVEDEPVNALLMRALFERIPDADLVVADCGAQALLAARELYPALLLLDLRLPDMRGDELLARLRTIPGCERPRAIAVSAECDFVLSGSGFDELWRKPLDVRAMIERIESLLAVARHDTPLSMPLLTTPALVAQIAARL